MKVMQTITDYIIKSILTTQGDLVVRGAAVPERLAAAAIGTILRGQGVGATPAYDDLTGAVGTILKGAGAGVVPTWSVPSMQYISNAMGKLTRATAGAQVITGLGFHPRLFLFYAVDSVVTNENNSWGFDNGTDHYSAFIAESDSLRNVSEVDSIYIRRNPTNYLTGVVSATGVDGFTITWTMNGAAGLYVVYLAIG